jgi:hypothetical protein
MDTFTITSRLTTKEYAKIMFIGLYKKPAFILCTILGTYYLITFLLDFLNVINFYIETPFYEIFLCSFLLLSPLFIIIISVKQFVSNPSFQSDIKYTFGENQLTVEGLTFKGEFLWAHIIKEKEINKFLILYHNNRMGNFIDKTKLTSEQLQYIKSKIKKK